MSDACYVYDPLGRVCTLDQGHQGEHVAHDIHGDVVVAWPNRGELVEFLLARIAEDEAAARAAVTPDDDGARPWTWVDWNSEDAAEHGYRHDPARVLAECEAKRRIVEEHRPILPPDSSHSGWCRMCLSEDGVNSQDYGGYLWPCLTLRLLTLPYADHADYREEWRP